MSSTELEPYRLRILLVLQNMQIEVVREFRARATIRVQDGEIRQVLANLIGNAMDALPSGGRIVLRTAMARNWRTGQRGIAITVADNGSGMDEDTLSRIFEPFFSTKGITGTGLGLWISHEIITKHHGTMRVRSRRALAGNAGHTVFRIFIPAPIEAISQSDPERSLQSLTRRR